MESRNPLPPKAYAIRGVQYLPYLKLENPHDLICGVHNNREAGNTNLGGFVCSHGTGFALIPAMVLQKWSTESKMALWRVVLWRRTPQKEATSLSKSSGNG